MVMVGTPSVSPANRDSFYAVAVAGLRAMDMSERSPQRFGADADTRWSPPDHVRAFPSAARTWLLKRIDATFHEAAKAEPSEGPTVEELASAVGATRPLVARALKVLEKEDRVEKYDKRPARHVATGGAE